MTGSGDTPRGDPSESVRLALLETFDSYHSNIREQVALVERLMSAVEREERRRCLAIVANALATARTAEGRAVAEGIAREMDTG